MKNTKKLLFSFLCLLLVAALNLSFTASITAIKTVSREENNIDTESIGFTKDIPEIFDKSFIEENN